jgi:hypothetical protein
MKKRIKHRRQFKSLDETAFYSGAEAYQHFELTMRELLTVSKEDLDKLRREHKKRKA